MRKYALYPEQEFNRTMRTILILIVLAFVSFAAAIVFASPALLDSQTMNNGDGTETFMSQSGGWWQDDSGNVQRTDSSLKPSDGVWDIENTSAPHHVYAATDEVRWRVDPPAGESAGFEIAFSTVSLYLFDEVNGDVEKTINWPRVPLDTAYDGTTITFPLFNDISLYVLSTPEGYKSNLFISNPSLLPDPSSNDYFGASVELSSVYFAVRYSVSKWPDSPMLVDGEPFGPGSITDGYSAIFGDDLWMLPTKAYRNVTGFNGQSWRDAEDESYVYYVFDRLAQEILVLAPYTLCVGADNILIDPTTWTSGRTDSDAASWITSNLATTNFGSDNFVDVGWNSSTQRHGLMKFASLPSNPNVTNVSATMILFYQGQSTAASMSTVVSRLLRNWVESEVTYNVYSTGNSWGTAGANNSTTDYDGSTATVYTWGSAANFVINDATLNTWVDGWIEGTYPNYGLNLFRNGSTVTDYKDFNSDDYATASARPYLAITYTSSNTLASLPDTTSVSVIPGSILSYYLIDTATTATINVAEFAVDVTAELLLDDGTSVQIGEGAGADDSWDTQAASDLVGGGSMFVLASNYDLTQAAACALYFESSLTGYTETRSFGLSPAGGGGSSDATLAMQQAIFGSIQNVSTDGTWGLQALAEKTDDATAYIATIITNVSTALTDWTRYQPQSTKYPIVCYPTGTDIGTLFVPEGVPLYEDASLELLASFSADAATPDMEISVRNDAGNALISFNARDAYHAGSWSFSRESLAQIDSTTRYILRMRYEIPSSALTASGTGSLHVIGTYRNPMYGTQPINNTVAMYSKPLDGSELDAVNTSITAVDVSLTSLDTEINKINPSSTVIYMASGVEIRGATWTGTRYEAAPGYCNVVTGCPAVIQKTLDDGTKWNLFLHYEETNLNVPVPVAFVADGAWTVSAGKVTAANATDAVKATGQSEDVLWYTEVSGF